MAKNESVTVAVLEQIRDEVVGLRTEMRDTREVLSARIDQTNADLQPVVRIGRRWYPHPMAGEVDIAPAQRLLQAVCYPGHAILMHGRRIVLSTGDATVLAGIDRLADREPTELAFTVTWSAELVACVRRLAFHTLIVVLPRAIDVTRVHEKMSSAIELFAGRAHSAPWTPSSGAGGGGSGAPAEVFAQRVRPRPS